MEKGRWVVGLVLGCGLFFSELVAHAGPKSDRPIQRRQMKSETAKHSPKEIREFRARLREEIGKGHQLSASRRDARSSLENASSQAVEQSRRVQKELAEHAASHSRRRRD